MNNEFISLLNNCQSSDKSTRENAEAFLVAQTSSDPSRILGTLLEVVISTNDNSLRLFGLLTMRKFISIHWADDLSRELKFNIKKTVLEIAMMNNDNKSVNNCCRYIIVQVCVYEFPEEWDGLIDEIFSFMNNEDGVYNGLLLLNELCEETITFDIFFDEKYAIYRRIFEFMNGFASTDYKLLNEVIKLYSNSINFYKLISEINNNYNQTINEFLIILNQKIINNFNGKFFVDESYFSCLKTYFDFLQFLILEFKQSLNSEQITIIISQGITNLKWFSELYRNNMEKYEDDQMFNNLVINVISYFKIIMNYKKYNSLLVEHYSTIIDTLIELNKFSVSKKESLMDINEIIEDCLDKDMNLNKFGIRDQIEEFFYNNTTLQNLLFQKLTSYYQDYENLLTLLTYCIDEESSNIKVLKQDILASIIEKIEQMDDLNIFRLIYLTTMIKEDSNLIIKVYQQVTKLLNRSTFINFSIYWFISKNLYHIDSAIDYNVEISVLKGVYDIIDEVETEKYHTIIEIILQLSERDFNNWQLEEVKSINFVIFELILKICSTEDNQDLNSLAMYDDLEMILSNIFKTTESSNSYQMEFCNKYMVDLIPLLDPKNSYFTRKFTLMILNSLIKNWHISENVALPIMVINYILEPLVKLINHTLINTDDSLIDDMITLLNNIIKNTDDKDIKNSENILDILSNVLNLGGCICNKLGTLTITILSKLPKDVISIVLDDIILKIVNLFINEKNANNFKILEDLNNFICYIFINDNDYAINLLTTKVQEKELKVFFDKWFEIFESIRGNFSIKCNIISFINIFNNYGLNMLMVKGNIKNNAINGDRVITRSMSKKMVIEYDQISVNEKILIILINECLMQIANKKDSYEYEVGENEEDDDEWEDINTNMDYTQLNDLLKYSVQDEDEDDDEAAAEVDDVIDGINIPNKSSLQVIITFLKTITNTNEFKSNFKELPKDQQNDLINVLL